MIIYLKNDGSIQAVYPSVLTQGSNIGQIIAIGEGLSNFSTLKINLTLPNGQLYYGGIMTPTNQTGYVVNNEIVRVYTKSLTKTITHYAGVLKMSIITTDSAGNETRSFIGSIPIHETIPDIKEFPAITQTSEQIIGDIEAIYEQLVELYEGLVVENTEIVKNARADQEGNVIHETYQTIEDEDLETEDKTIVGAINEVNEQSGGTYEDVQGLIDGTIPAGKATADANGNNIANTYQTKTDNTLDTQSKSIVGAINELKALIQQIIFENYATTEVPGIVELATDAEAIAGIDTTRVITPKQLQDNIKSAISSAVKYIGKWTVSSATTDYSFFETYIQQHPLTGIKQGYMWFVGGTQTTIDGVLYKNGDAVIFNKNVTIIPVETSDIDLIDNTDLVTSVNGQTGEVELDLLLKLTDAQLAQYALVGGIDDGTIAICKEVTDATIGYKLGSIYRFDITEPSTYEWTELTGSATWGNIQGTLSNQEDLQDALDEKSTVSVSETGTSTSEVKYITIDGVQYKISGDVITQTSQLENDGEDGEHPFITAEDLPASLDLTE